jgi:uncharacterized damage-inducible protein DinB
VTLAEVWTLIDYHYWALERLFDTLERLTPGQFTQRIENSFPSVRETMVHMWGAEVVWIARWDGESLPGLPDGRHLPDLAALRTAWKQLHARLQAIVERLGEDGVNRPFEYRSFDGTLQQQPFSQMLQHVVNHGSYHRGQVTMMLRQLGVAPAKQMDLIAFYRAMART